MAVADGVAVGELLAVGLGGGGRPGAAVGGAVEWPGDGGGGWGGGGEVLGARGGHGDGLEAGLGVVSSMSVGVHSLPELIEAEEVMRERNHGVSDFVAGGG